MYNVSWQSFFTEAVEVGDRNRILTMRQKWRMVPAMLLPLVTGTVLSSLPEINSKIIAHQSFFILAAGFAVAQIFLINKLKSIAPAPVIGINLSNIKKAAAALVKNKKFLVFCATILTFYMSFQFDWTLYFIGLTRYLELNEALIGITILTEAMAAFFSIRFWSRMNEKYGVTLPLLFGMMIICFFPLVLLLTTSMTSGARVYIFLVGHALCSVGIACFWLNVFQCLLTTLQNEYRTISISIFSVLTSLSNALMPMTGVLLYNRFGADLAAFQTVCRIIFVTRIFAASMWFLRWRFTETGAKPGTDYN